MRSRLIEATPAQVFSAMSQAERVARWWGPAGFSSTVHRFDFEPGGDWTLTLHGPDGVDYPNHNRFARIDAPRLLVIDHLSTDHHFLLTLELVPEAGGTRVHWCQTFDTAEHHAGLAEFVATANEQNLDRLAAEVARNTVGSGV
jgi:uncharacterized protein YndB with AHSA1/START domain